MEKRVKYTMIKGVALVSVLQILAGMSLTGCGKAEGEDTKGVQSQESTAQPEWEEKVEAPAPAVKGTRVVLDGREYDLADRNTSVNAIVGIQEVDGYWIVEGHISPSASYYGFYNMETGQWDKEFTGYCLTWATVDEEGRAVPFSLDSVVYAVANEVYDSDDKLLGRIDLDEAEYEYIWELKRTASGVEVQILNAAVEARNVTIELASAQALAEQ